MPMCGLYPSLNMSENWTLPQDVTMTHNMAEDFPFLNIENLETHIIGGFCMLISMFGMVVNGIVLRFLCFCLKGNTFMYIKKIAIADFGVLFVMFIYFLQFFVVYLYGHSHYLVCVMNLCLNSLFVVLFCASGLFLSALSVDRCVAIFFPLWYRCHRPESLPIIVSALLWTSASLEAGLIFYDSVLLGNHIVEITVFSLFYSFIVLSILPLLIRVYSYSYLWRKGRLLKVTLFALSVFIITLFPQNFLLIFIQDTKMAYLVMPLLICLNSSTNPFIYFLVGRLTSSPSTRTVKVVLNKLFNEDDNYEHQSSSSKTSV